MKRHEFYKSSLDRKVRFQTSAGRWVFLQIWRDVFGNIHVVKNAFVRTGVLTWEERTFKVQTVGIMEGVRS